MASLTLPSYSSVFSRNFDVAVYGTGFLGLSCAYHLVESGLSVLLLDSSGDLLWEATRALENKMRGSDRGYPWIRDFDPSASSADQEFFEPAMAEIAAASWLSNGEPRIRTLLFAFPVEAEVNGGRITSITVATKDGRHSIKASRWIDASENGEIGRLVGVSNEGREPDARYRSLVLQTSEPALFDAGLSKLNELHPDVESLSSVKQGERRLRYRVGEMPWNERVVSILRTLRGCIQNSGGTNFIVSHCALQDYPVYEGRNDETNPELQLPENLAILSPAFTVGSLKTISDRIEYGVSQARVQIAAIQKTLDTEASDSSASLHYRREETLVYDVVVIGSGTAGAVAAIASSGQGAKTLAVDLASFPGGVGTGGGINGYFHGASGGLQDQLDLRVNTMTRLFLGKDGVPNRWHHDAKKLVLLEEFAESGVRFLGNALLGGIDRNVHGTVKAIRVVVGSLEVSVMANAFIDATGDGDLCNLAGAHSLVGRQGDSRTLAFSQVALALVKNGDSLSVKSLNFDSGWVDPADPEDLTRARLSGIAQYEGAGSEVKETVLTIAPILGLRQSRQIDTDFTLTLSELITHANFSDSIGRVETVADTHSVDYEFEDDLLAFYYWTCRGFRNPLYCELPYGVLLPKNLKNVWIACRALGVDISASYGVRMQREMQRIGEVAGVAAALASQSGAESRKVDVAALREVLRRSGAVVESISPHSPFGSDELLQRLDGGKPGIHLWHLQHEWPRDAAAVKQRIDNADENVSFYAAAVCAMAQDPAGNERLIRSIEDREVGLTPEQARVTGAHGQCIDVPFWLQALMLLRRTGDRGCLNTVVELARESGHPFNVRTVLALTLERLAQKVGNDPRVFEVWQILCDTSAEGAVLPPSRSLWRELHGLPVKPLHNDQGIDTRENHVWQMQLILDRIRRVLGFDSSSLAHELESDPRGYVRQAFGRTVKSM